MSDFRMAMAPGHNPYTDLKNRDPKDPSLFRMLKNIMPAVETCDEQARLSTRSSC